MARTTTPSPSTAPPKVFEASAARLVLDDCEFALTLLEGDPRGPVWRVTWVAVLALLRTVYEVLKNVDLQSPLIREEMKAKIRAFIDANKGGAVPETIRFVNEHANPILHSYDFKAAQRVMLLTDADDLVLAEAVSAARTILVEEHRRDELVKVIVSYPIKAGVRRGEDQRAAVRAAIDWWRATIEEIELRAAADAIELKPDA